MTIKTTIKKSRTCELNLAPITPEREGGKGKPRSRFPQKGEAQQQNQTPSQIKHQRTASSRSQRVASTPH